MYIYIFILKNMISCSLGRHNVDIAMMCFVTAFALTLPHYLVHRTTSCRLWWNNLAAGRRSGILQFGWGAYVWHGILCWNAECLGIHSLVDPVLKHFKYSTLFGFVALVLTLIRFEAFWNHRSPNVLLRCFALLFRFPWCLGCHFRLSRETLIKMIKARLWVAPWLWRSCYR